MADSCEMMLRDTRLPEIMAKEKPGLYKQIREWIANFAEKLRKAFTGVEARHEEARAMMQYAEEMQQIWDNALAGAVRNTEAATENGTATPNNGTERGKVRWAKRENTALSEEDGAAYMQVGNRQHVRELKNNMLRRGDSPLLYTESEIKAFIEESLNGKNPNTIKAYGRVGTRMADDIAAKANRPIDVAGYYLELDSNRIEHMKGHVEDDRDRRNIPLSQEQIQELPQYIDTYDEILDVLTRKDGSTRVYPGKESENGNIVILELVSKGRQSMQPVTAWQNTKENYQLIWGQKKKAANTSHASRDDAERGYKATSADNIPQPGEKSNPKFSMRDTAYTTAVESGNTEDAQRLVDEAAEEALENSEARLTDRGEFRMGAGKLATVYHATYNDFTVFDRARLGENTDAYASDESTAATAHLGFWFNTQPLSQSASYAGGKDVKAYLNAENIYNAHSLEQLTGEIEQQWDEELTPEENAEEYVDGLKAQGYDGIVLRDEEFGGTSFVVFDPEQIKSAEAITYDDAGNVIPLSERFNSRSNDIRYSMRDVAADDTADERRGRGAWIKILKHIFKHHASACCFFYVFFYVYLSKSMTDSAARQG